MQTNTKELKIGVVLSYCQTVLHILSGLIVTPLYIKYLGKSEYGIYSLAYAYISYFSLFDFGLSGVVVRFTSKYLSSHDDISMRSFWGCVFRFYIVLSCLALFAGTIFYFASHSLFGEKFTAEELILFQKCAIVGTLNAFFNIILSMFGGIIIAYEKFIIHKSVSLIVNIISMTCTVYMLFSGYRVVSIITVIAICHVSSLIFYVLYCCLKLHVRIFFGTFSMPLIKDILAYSVWTMVGMFMNQLYWYTGQFVLGKYVGAEVISYYSIPISFQSIFTAFSTAISGVFLPRITKMYWGEQADNNLSNLFIKVGRIQYLVLSLVLCGFIVFGHNVIVLWLGNDMEIVYNLSLAFFIPLTIPLIQNLGITILQAKNQLKFRAVALCSVAVLAFILQVIGTKYYHLWGCVLSTTLSLIIGQFLVMNIYYYKVHHIDIPLFWINIGKMTIAPVILTAILYQYLSSTCDFSLLFLRMILFTICFCVTAWFFMMNLSEKQIILDFAKKIFLFSEQIHE